MLHNLISMYMLLLLYTIIPKLADVMSDYNCCHSKCMAYFTPQELHDLKCLQTKMTKEQQKQAILTSMLSSVGKSWKQLKFTLLVSLRSSQIIKKKSLCKHTYQGWIQRFIDGSHCKIISFSNQQVLLG